MRDQGVIERVSRGLYRLAALDPLAHPDLVTVAKRVPHGVLYLISALSFHELRTQVPHTVDLAPERGTRKPRVDYPPTLRPSGAWFERSVPTTSSPTAWCSTRPR